ncbi:MAG: DUF669 domain-containing protein [Armatimonadota bacterium]|nr:DUF669 domain-containing protein [bacterium]
MMDDYYPEQDVEVEEFDLSHLRDAYNNAIVEEREYEDVGNGKYQVRVAKAEIVHAKTTDNTMLKWTLQIIGPKHAGRYLWRNNVLAEDSIKWLKSDLRTCGVVLGDINELRSRLKDLIGLCLEINKQNDCVYINKRIVIADPERRVEDSALAPF